MRTHLLAFATLTALVACAKEQPAPSPAPGTKLGETASMTTPESVRYDAETDVYFVSNINGNPSQKDNNGFIARVRADSTGVVTMLAEGGMNGVTLNAPKGMAILGDTLFIADITDVRMINKKTGAWIGSVDLASQKATFLNDVANGPDGIYITDTGIKFDAKGAMTHPGSNMVFRLDGKKATVIAAGDSLANPNGITWDPVGKRWILCPFGGPNVQSLDVGQKLPVTIAPGPGGYDGVEVLPNGTILVSSWTDSSVSMIPPGHPMLMPFLKNVSAPADIGVDTKRNVLAVPRFNDGKVEYYKLP
jgi:sugar lactone lactonase YvrE